MHQLVANWRHFLKIFHSQKLKFIFDLSTDLSQDFFNRFTEYFGHILSNSDPFGSPSAFFGRILGNFLTHLFTLQAISDLFYKFFDPFVPKMAKCVVLMFLSYLLAF
jgi:hypothetical protein